MRHHYTTQAQVRMSFWENSEGISRAKERKHKREYGDFRTDIRVAFVDYIDMLARAERITEPLAQKVTLR